MEAMQYLKISERGERVVAGERPVDDVLELAGTALQTVAHVQAHRAGNLIGNVVSLTIAGVVMYTLLTKWRSTL